jgi:hypothetical protein
VSERDVDDARDTAWCQGIMRSLADGGIWGVPRSGLIFTKRGDKLVLTSRMPHMDGLPMTPADLVQYQRDDYELIKERFTLAGFEVEDDTEPDEPVQES